MPSDATLLEVNASNDTATEKIYDSNESTTQTRVVTNHDMQQTGSEELSIIDNPQEIIQKTLDNKTSVILDGIPTPVAELENLDIIEDGNDTKLLVVNQTAKEYTVKCETEAAYKIEEEQSTDRTYNKTDTVAHD
jgi:adenylate kinase family enzyme